MVISPEETVLRSPQSRRILIYGINYWPEVTGIAPYTTGLAQHLVSRGHDVKVVTGMPHYPEWRVYENYRGRRIMRETIDGVDVHRLAHYVPARQSAKDRALYEATFLAHGATRLGVKRPDVVVGIVPSLSGGTLASIAAARFQIPFGLVVQDLMGQAAAQSGIAGGGRVAGLTADLEARVMRRADRVAVIAEGFRRQLTDMGVDSSCIQRVRNWTHVGSPTESRHETRARLGIPIDAKVCLHAGNMGFKQGLENVVETARRALETDSALLFVMMGDGNQRALLQELASDLTNVRFLPPQPEAEFPNALAAADILLVNQRPSVLDMSLPGKLTSYFAAGRPVVAAVAPQSETALEITMAGAGVVVDAGDPGKLLEAIRYIIDDQDQAATLGERGRAYAAAHLTADAALAGLDAFILGMLNTATQSDPERAPRPSRNRHDARVRNHPVDELGH